MRSGALMTATRLAGAALTVLFSLAAAASCPLPERACRVAPPPPCHGHAPQPADEGRTPDCCSGGHELASAALVGAAPASVAFFLAPVALPSSPSLPPAVPAASLTAASDPGSPPGPTVLLHTGRSPPLA